MKPVDLPGRNVIFAENQPEYQNLPAIVLPGEKREVITCWEMDDAEFEDFSKHRKLFLSQWTFGEPLQPILPSVSLDAYLSPSDEEFNHD